MKYASSILALVIAAALVPMPKAAAQETEIPAAMLDQMASMVATIETIVDGQEQLIAQDQVELQSHADALAAIQEDVATLSADINLLIQNPTRLQQIRDEITTVRAGITATLERMERRAALLAQVNSVLTQIRTLSTVTLEE